MQSIRMQQQIKAIIEDPAKTHKQTMFELAEFCENLCDYDYPIPIPEDFFELVEKGILCDHNDGHAPYCPRYILPDYEWFLKNGSDFLGLPPPKDLQEACAYLLMLYLNVPSVTHYPVFIGRVDRLLEPFVERESEESAKKILRLFLLSIDRMISDSFCHMNLGPEETRTGRLLIGLLAELQLEAPNCTLLYDPAVTPDAYAEQCILAALSCANPAFALDAVYRSHLGEQYGIASCYNGLLIGGGAYTLSRMRLGRVAENSVSEQDFFDVQFPHAIDAACTFMEAKIRFLREQIPFFRSSFLVSEGMLQPERFTGMFGIVGMQECVDALMKMRGRSARYGRDAEANETAVTILTFLRDRVGAFESKYCEATGHRFLLHSQIGACNDNGVTPGVRIAIGNEPPLYEHLRQAATVQPFFPAGVSDIFSFDDTARRNPSAVLDILKGAFGSGMQYLAIYHAQSDLIRVAGYLIKRSDMEAFQQGKAVLNASVGASRETIECRGTYDRKVRSL